MNPTKDNTKFRGEDNQSIRFAGSELGAQRHICAFFHSADEEYRVVLPFIKDGFECHHKAFHVVDPKLLDKHRERLASAGIDVPAAEGSGQFDLRNWGDVYLRDGRFDKDRMLALLREVLEAGREQGFALTRMVAHVEWALEKQPGVDDLVEYETRVNYIWPQYKDAVICVYDLAKFGGHIVMDILRTHPMVLIGGIIQENPFFVPPDEFLRELRERRASRTKLAA
jgi:hypothetical protein